MLMMEIFARLGEIQKLDLVPAPKEFTKEEGTHFETSN